jgi:hypothetical protein
MEQHACLNEATRLPSQPAGARIYHVELTDAKNDRGNAALLRLAIGNSGPPITHFGPVSPAAPFCTGKKSLNSGGSSSSE